MHRQHLNLIPYARQSISEADIQAVIDILKSDWLTQGPTIPRFEKMVADYCGVRYAVAISSATAGLHIAALAAGLEPGHLLWTSPNTFVASANCALYAGASIDFVDIDPKTYNLDVQKLADKLERANTVGKLPKVVIPVHFAGQSCPMEPIAELAQKYGFQIIEDASHGIGGYYQNQPVGNCCYSDMTVFSFHPVKIITTGEGGMVLTNQLNLYEKLIRLRTHGITRDPQLLTNHNPPPWYYEQVELGYNYRLTDIQAALGISQMQRLEQFVERRRYLAKRYDELLQDLPLILPRQSPETRSSWHLYVVRLRLDKIHKSHRQVFEELRAEHIGVNLHYIPVHTQPYYQGLGFQWGDFPEAEQYYGEALTLPLYYELTEQDQDQVVSLLRNLLF
ncbi:Cys/Met metabolism pyridoxal-phosphate-dependent enzyme [Gloeomargarita lithophora Alchichica-D10]|uniref:Cys/Met metabolism pyridoxal-phosphate-dependent enzyme n=1 Tax=Gloeomargarita lithophora Alchichica-D10 TaxID=1188229 RepID=A0A1J0AG46_9CYAN|nr:UDP-4-amino-4,6-dideoxy-N-acetyl-beta-L-altrosamine transaminase [Gloeomargarita lithophora]APB34914.1 Cys/Met metabolism pyridoxal-phosphate-dependent enzyme [Gloeomargarita lithophora Alchichica-D10]